MQISRNSRETNVTEPTLDLPVELGAPSIAAALEAILLIVDTPIDSRDLASGLGLPEPEVLEALKDLQSAYLQRESGVEIREIAGGWRFYSSASCHVAVERFVRDGQQARLTQAALETLAIIAYRQPISRGRIAAIRGVNVDSVVRTLVQRGLIQEAGEEMDGQSVLFRTTEHFLERMGLRSLDELPPVAEHLPSIEAITGLDASI